MQFLFKDGSTVNKSATSCFLLPIFKEELAEQLELACKDFQISVEALLRRFKENNESQVQLIHGNGSLLLFIRLEQKMSHKQKREAFRKAFAQVNSEERCLLLLEHLDTSSIDSTANAAIQGAWESTYQLGFLKSGRKEETKTKEVSIVGFSSQPHFEEEIANIVALAKGREFAAHLVNLPPNMLTPKRLAEQAIALSTNCVTLKVSVLDERRIKEKNLGALEVVARGSAEPPRFIVLEYKGSSSNGSFDPEYAFVGKGITFDTGGISIKPANNMHYMKSDMGGAAAILGLFKILTELQPTVDLVGIIPAAENKTGSKALMPAEIITAHNGKTIEVIDTDAEGRLILADGLSYAVRTYKPRILVDLATLTGASVISLGYEAGALLSNNDELADRLKKAGSSSGEQVWPLPLWDEYGKPMESDIADIKNYGGPAAGTITAAKFLEHFIEGHTAWAHLDIAGVAFGDSAYSRQKVGTGFGANLLWEFVNSTKK